MKTDLKKLANFAIDYAQTIGATAAELSASMSDGFDVVVRMGEVDTVEYQKDHAFSITIYNGTKKGSASTTNFSEANIKKVVESAKTIADVTTADPYAGLAEKELMAKQTIDLDTFHHWDIEPKAAIELAKECEYDGFYYDKRIKNSDGVSVSTHEGCSVYANTHGFIGEASATRHDISCVLIAAENDKMEADYYYDHHCDPQKLQSIKSIAEKAASKAVKRLNPQKISTRKAPVILTPEVARSMMRQFVSAISGSQLYRQASFLVDHLGKPVFSKALNIHEQPHLKQSSASAWFDSDGVATTAKHFVREGVLENYCLGSYSARRLNMQTTANADGVHNLMIDPTAGDFKTLLKQMDTGLLVTDLLGHGGNLVTGDYSSGAAGFWVEQGEIQYPVAEITIAANLRDLFLNLVAVANDIDTRGNIRTGSILFEQMIIAGQ